jgi:uncharacterized protein YcbX
VEATALSTLAPTTFGSVVFLCRYPVKSMMGEEMNASHITATGLLGDRAYALIDSLDGKVATAKNPRKWPTLFDFRAGFDIPPTLNASLPPVRITFPDGTLVSSEQSNASEMLSKALTRQVTIASATDGASHAATAEEYWLDFKGLEHRDTVTDFGLPEGTFFDCAVVHVMTTATLDRLRALYPQGRFEPRRFRPNIIVQSADGASGFVEDEWVGRVVAIGDDVRLGITASCSRCVMTTLSQGDLPKDSGILRATVRHNRANAGVYASVLRTGHVRRGDAVRLE